MNTIQRLLFLCLGLAVAGSTLSAVDIGARRAEEQKKAAAMQEAEDLGILNTAKLKLWGPAVFYKSSSFHALTEGQKKTFFDQWVQQAIAEQSPAQLFRAFDKAAVNEISLDPEMTSAAIDMVKKSMKYGENFLKIWGGEPLD